MKPITFASFFLAVALLPALTAAKPAVAQVKVSQLVTHDFNTTVMSTQTRTTQANIVISVRDFSQTDAFCGNPMSLDFARPGRLGDSFDFPHAGRQSDRFPHPGQSMTLFASGTTTYFQLPTGTRNPDMIGCVDTQRNTVFITIKPPRQAVPTQPSLPQPLPPVQPSTQPSPNHPTLTDPQTQRLLPRQSQSFPAGVSPNHPSMLSPSTFR